MIYLDYNATSPLKPGVKAMLPQWLDWFGNPSSVHRLGRQLRGRLDAARKRVASSLGTSPAQLVFTSGATEAINLAIAQYRGQKIVISDIEHDAVRQAVPTAARCPVKSTGEIDLAALQTLLVAEQPKLLAVMMVNNETGVIQPISEIIQLAHAAGCAVLVDAVQALGKLPVDAHALGADWLAVSAHKVGGLPGAGGLVVPANRPITPQLLGGGQEMNRRAGTENWLGILAFAAALENLAAELAAQPQLATWRDQFEATILRGAPGAIIAGKAAPRVANTSCVLMPGIKSETQVIAMDLAGIAISAGSACSSGKVKQSPVLTAMGFAPDLAGAGLRFSAGHATTEQEFTKAAQTWLAVYLQLANQPRLAALAAAA